MHPTHRPAAPVEVTPADTLRDAARYITAHGWTQGGYYDYRGRSKYPRACTSGAIGYAAYGFAPDNPHHMDQPQFDVFDKALNAFRDYLEVAEDLLHDVPDATVGEWNDQPDMTPARVIRALNAAADRWEQQARERTSDEDWDRTFGGAR